MTDITSEADTTDEPTETGTTDEPTETDTTDEPTETETDHESDEIDYPDPSDIGSTDGPPVEQKPYKILFEANRCIGAGKCAEVGDTWELDITTGIAAPRSFFIGEDELEANVEAAARCPAKKGQGAIHVIDRRTGEEVAPDPHGDGMISVDW